MRRIPTKSCLAACCILAASAMAQTGGGVFRGEVRDASGAMVSSVRIEFHSTTTGLTLAAESNDRGLYVSPDLIPGVWTLRAERNGFETEVAGPILLEVNQTVRVDFGLRVGKQSESMQVKAAAGQMPGAESAELSQVIGAKAVAEMPLNGRAWQQLILLSGGVNPGAPGESGSPYPVNVYGQRTKGNLFLADGISVTSSALGRGNSFNIPLEAVQEFSVQAGAYSAEYGDVAGAVINVQSKSGTNDWHGSLFEFLRNDRLDASDFFSNATGQARNPLRYNQFGGSLGGPLRRGRTLFFADYQGMPVHTSAPMVVSLPTAAQRRGDFSAQTAPIYNPFAPSPVRPPFPGNVIPASLVDPAAAAISAALPLPNQFSASGQPLAFNNYAVARVSTSAVHSFDVRIDHQFSGANSAFLRHSFQNTDANVPSLFGPPLGGSLEGAGMTRARLQNVALGNIYQFSPSFFNELRMGIDRQTTLLTQEDYGQNLSARFGIPGINTSPQTSGLANLSIAGLFDVGDSLLTPLSLATTDENVSEKITWARGHHVFRAGVDYQRGLGSTGYLVYGRGFYTFLNLTTSSLVGTPGGNAYASFLTGAPYQVLRDQFTPGLAGLLSWRYGLFAQDDIRLTPHFTVNLGVRYDVMPYPSEMHNRLSNFDPASGTILLAGQGANERLVRTDYGDLAPWIGIAWAPGSQTATVLRTGFGVSYTDPYGSAGILNSNEFNAPFYNVGNVTIFPFTAPTVRLSDGAPPVAAPSLTAPSGNQRYLDPNARNPFSRTWSLEIRHAISNASLFSVSYVGVSGERLLMASNINAAQPGATAPAPRRPYGAALAEIRELSNTAQSIYNGLEARFERRFSRGLHFLGSWTWSKSLDDQSNGTDNVTASGQYPQDPLHPELDRGLSSFDRSQVLVASAVWEIPFRRAGWRPLRAAAAGWQLSGILTAETGPPFSVLMACADVNADGNNCRPNRLASGVLANGQRSIAKWFDTAAFAIPSPQAWGNAGRNILRGPGDVNLDFGIARSIALAPDAAKRRLQLRGEFFNALNHANFGLPQGSIDSPAFGAITTSAPARQIQLGARLEF
ncbi:MAG TPA: carboxypeptidase regulatory-like domain-containing protein [Bryobacteraceae bacterium]|nr:carboxypeptidase regulatory-like domain-containing protein [Bryobacteraceae bacterium]